MLAARLYAPRDMRIDQVPMPEDPEPEHVLIRVTAVGVCGSDLHTYLDGRIGDTAVQQPLTLGHEFGGVIEQVGANALDGNGDPLRVGQRVAVDPATPCWRCEMCEHGHPNLCRRLHFCGLFPDDGSLCEYMIVGARECYPVPDAISDVGAAMLEPLGVALHAVDLGKVKVTNSVAILGCGPIGLLIAKLIAMSGAHPVYAFDKFAWRAEKAKTWAGVTEAWTIDEHEPVRTISEVTHGRGVDIVIEAAWADHSIAQAAEMARLGGRLVLVGIPSEDQVVMKHSTARRKGLTIMMSRRMKHVYPRVIQLATQQNVDIDGLVSHRFPLSQADKAFALNVDYPEGIVKVMITPDGK